MDLGRPNRRLGMGVTGDVLVALAALDRPLSGRRVAARANASTTQVLKVLGDLVDAGVVIATPAPPSLLFELNRDHVLAPVVAAIASASNSWRERLVEAISRWEPPADAVVLFGSAATGVADDRSDIDLLVVRPVDVGADDDTWASQVAALATALPDRAAGAPQPVAFALPLTLARVDERWLNASAQGSLQLPDEHH